MPLEQLILLRHGRTEWNASQRMQGHRDVPMDTVGEAQAAAVAPSVNALGFDVVVSSDLDRAMVTARTVAQASGLPVRTDPRLRETSLGEWEGLRREEVAERWPERWAAWRHSGARIAPPGGESRVYVAHRAAGVVADLDAGTGRRALLVTHGGLMVGLTGLLLDMPDELWGSLAGVGNCHWVVLHRAVGRWRLHTYNGGLGAIVWPSADDDIAEG